jgi:hypothetical protein
LCGFSAVSFWSFSRWSSTIAWSRAALLERNRLNQRDPRGLGLTGSRVRSNDRVHGAASKSNPLPMEIAPSRGRPNSRVTRGHLDHSSGAAGHSYIEFETAVRIHMISDQRRQGSRVSWGELVSPLRLRQNLLEHKRVDIDHAVLQQV